MPKTEERSITEPRERRENQRIMKSDMKHEPKTTGRNRLEQTECGECRQMIDPLISYYI